MGKSYDSFLFDLYGTLADIHTDEEKDALWEACARELKRQGITARPDSLREQYTQGVRELETRDRLTRGPGAEIDLEPVFRRMLEAGEKKPPRSRFGISLCFSGWLLWRSCGCSPGRRSC